MQSRLRNIVIILSLFIPGFINAQELKCNVQIVSQQVQGTNKKIFETLQTALYEFINNRNWTNHVYTNEERIECSILINVQDYSSPTFKGTMQIQARRPVFGSSYNTVLLNYLDQNIQFDYIEFAPLEYSETSFRSNLTSLMAYYAYIILGIDYDSFSFKGGTEWFKKAEAIVSNAQGAAEKGWKAYEGSSNKNRYWLVQNFLDDKYSPVRDFIYKYHRLGLDRMSERANEGRDEIAEDLKLLLQVYRTKPDPYMHLMQVINDAKSDEWVNIFSESLPEEKTRVVKILKEIDAPNSSKYQKITQ